MVDDLPNKKRKLSSPSDDIDGNNNEPPNSSPTNAPDEAVVGEGSSSPAEPAVESSVNKQDEVIQNQSLPKNDDAEELNSSSKDDEGNDNNNNNVAENTNNSNNNDDDDNSAATGEDDKDNEATPTSKKSPPSKTNNNPKPFTNPYDSIRRCIVQNDGTRQNLIRLIGLKSLFAKQLPKMPKEYIARLVFNKQHTSLALLSNDTSKKDTDEEIIGGICYRAYNDTSDGPMKFAEIAFCAVSASQQVKGYGTKLMNLLKMHAVTEGIEYFITYADNYAIG